MIILVVKQIVVALHMLKKQIGFIFTKTYLTNLCNKFLAVFGTIWLFIESASFFLPEQTSNNRLTLLVLAVTSASILSITSSFPRLSYSKNFRRSNVEIAVQVGRLNNQNQPMLYLASRKFTAFSEINANPGDYVHIIGYKICKNKSIKIGLIGDLFHVYRTGMSMLSSEAGEVLNNKLNSFEYEIGKSIVYVDAYLASILRNPNAKSNNYLHTRILGEFLFNKVTEVKSIFYPSVAQEGGMNLAMLPEVADDVLEVVSSSIVVVKDRWEFGMYDFIPIKDCMGITSNGSFLWKLGTNPRGYILFNQ